MRETGPWFVGWQLWAWFAIALLFGAGLMRVAHGG